MFGIKLGMARSVVEEKEDEEGEGKYAKVANMLFLGKN